MNIRLPLAFSAFLAIGAALLPGPSGFCYSELGFLSNEEVTRRVLAQINSYPALNRIVDIKGESVSAVQIPYNSIEEMRGVNADCCKVTKIIWAYNTRGEHRFGLFEWFFLNYAYYVSGKINGKFQLQNGIFFEKVGAIGDPDRVIDSCGQLKD